MPALPEEEEEILELPPIKARAARKPEIHAEAPIGLGRGLRVSRDEARKAASSMGDPSRFLQTLPGAGRTSDWTTDLVVRGGSPDQTVFVLDGVPVGRVNHYQGLRNEHGGSGIVNLEFAEELEFHRGPLPARLPDRLSGAVEMRFRDGNTRVTSSRLAADVTGVGGSLEGPVVPGADAGSYAAAFRYSALDLLVRSGVVEAYGPPRYWNGQARLAVPTGPDAALRLNAVGGAEEWYNGIGESAALDLGGHTFSLGLDWRGHDAGGWTRAAVLAQDQRQTADFRTDRSGSGADSLTHYEAGEEHRYGVALERVQAAGRRLTLRFGVSEDVVISRRRIENGDESTYLPYGDTVVIHTRALRVESRPFSETAAYGEATLRTGPWEWYAGYRHFYEELSDDHASGPRLGAAVRPSEAHVLKAAAGLHTQPHEFADVERQVGAARLPLMAQGALTWEWVPARGLMLTLEGFAKEGFRLPRSRMVRDARGFREAWLDTGRTRGRGVEALASLGRGGPLFLTAAYTFLHHRERDPLGRWSRGPYSIPHAFNAALGIALGAGLRLDLRYSVASGTPYTPLDEEASRAAGTGVYAADRAWSARSPRYEKVDLRLEAGRRVGTSQVTGYAELANVLGRRNAFGVRWNPVDGMAMAVEGMGRLPMAGVSVTF